MRVNGQVAETKALMLKEPTISSILEVDFDDDQTLLLMKALSSKTRLEILKILKKKRDVCEVARELKQTEANISAQIKILEKAHLITPRYESGRHGVKKVCEINVDQIIITL